MCFNNLIFYINSKYNEEILTGLDKHLKLHKKGYKGGVDVERMLCVKCRVIAVERHWSKVDMKDEDEVVQDYTMSYTIRLSKVSSYASIFMRVITSL